MVKVYKNGAWEEPGTVKEYVNGAWQDTSEIKVYKDGAWEKVYPTLIPVSLRVNRLSSMTDVWGNISKINGGSVAVIEWENYRDYDEGESDYEDIEVIVSNGASIDTVKKVEVEAYMGQFDEISTQVMDLTSVQYIDNKYGFVYVKNLQWVHVVTASAGAGSTQVSSNGYIKLYANDGYTFNTFNISIV